MSSDAYNGFRIQKSPSISWTHPSVAPNVWMKEKILRPNDNFFSAKSNRTIRVYLPPEDIAVEKMALKLTCGIVTVGSTYQRLANFATSLFEEVRLRMNGFEHVTRNFNILSAFMMHLEIPHEVKETQMYDSMGWGPDHIRSIWGQTDQEYVIPLRWLNTESGVLPLGAFKMVGGVGENWLEFVIAEPTTVIETDGTNPDITIKNVQIIHEQIDSKDDWYRQALCSLIRENGGKWSFPAIKLYQNSVVSSVSELTIPHKENNLHSITTALTDISKRNDMTVSGKFENYPKDFGAGCIVRTYQTDIKGILYPPERCDASDQAVQSYLAYLKAFGFYDSALKRTKFAPPIGIDEFNGSPLDAFFFMHQDLHSIGVDYNRSIDSEFVINPFNLRDDTRPILFKVDMVNPPPPGLNIVAYHIARYHQIVQLSSSGQVNKILA